MVEKFCILGGGAMGTACARILSSNPDHQISLWVRNPVFAQHIAETRQNARLLPGVQLPDQILVTSDYQTALTEAEVVVLCVPTRGIRAALSSLKDAVPKSALMVSAVKGIENDTLIRPSQMIQELLGDRPVVAFGGPCHAEEVAMGKPASVVAACDDLASAELIQQAFSNENLRVYSNTDLCGVELAGALKNVIAIAAGICDGLGFGDNARSALITRGLAEMVRFGGGMGVAAETFYGLAGIGDLIATCGSSHSRNRRVGELLGQGQSLPQIEESMQSVAEGVFTAKSVHSISINRHIEMPIAGQVYSVLFENKDPREATMELMQRPLKEE